MKYIKSNGSMLSICIKYNKCMGNLLPFQEKKIPFHDYPLSSLMMDVVKATRSCGVREVIR